MKKIKAFILAETQKNISLATFFGRGIKGEGTPTCHSEECEARRENSAIFSGLPRAKALAMTRGFTLAETLIVLVILGVVAAITVPALVNRHVEAERRTKLKKAMSVYDTALNKMVIENGIKSDTALSDWADSDTKNDCTNTSAYFKVARNLEVNGNVTNCKFRASDGVFWDISDIQKPLIALREQDLNDETAQSDTNRAFYMFGWFDENGSLRSNDMGKIDANNKTDLEKLYDFIAGKSTTSMGEIGSTPEPEPEPEPKTMNSIIDEYGTTNISVANMKNLINELKAEGYSVGYYGGHCSSLLAFDKLNILISMFDQKAYAAIEPGCYIKVTDNNGNVKFFVDGNGFGNFDVANDWYLEIYEYHENP